MQSFEPVCLKLQYLVLTPSQQTQGSKYCPSIYLELRSANTSVPSVAKRFTVVVMCWSTLPCLQVNLPWFSAEGQKLVLRASVQLRDELGQGNKCVPLVGTLQSVTRQLILLECPSLLCIGSICMNAQCISLSVVF